MIIYKGKGFFIGIPTRDLTDEEAKKFGRKKLIASGLYEPEVKGKKDVRGDIEDKNEKHELDKVKK